MFLKFTFKLDVILLIGNTFFTGLKINVEICTICQMKLLIGMMAIKIVEDLEDDCGVGQSKERER